VYQSAHNFLASSLTIGIILIHISQGRQIFVKDGLNRGLKQFSRNWQLGLPVCQYKVG